MMFRSGIFVGLLWLIFQLFGCNCENIGFPGEERHHNRTFMSFPEAEVWGNDMIGNIRQDIIRIAKAISDYELVTILVSPRSRTAAEALIGYTQNIEIFDCDVNDLWARDTLPAFLLKQSQDPSNGQQRNSIVAVNLNFNGWGEKQEAREDDQLAAEKLINHFQLEERKTWLVGESGGFEFDGEGTVLATRSSWVNENRNPGRSEDEITQEVKRVFNVQKVIWFDGVYGQDITDAHIDSIARFIKPGRVLLSRPFVVDGYKDVWANVSDQVFEVLQKETDASGRPFEIIEVFEPDRDQINIVANPDAFVTSYANYYVANEAVIIPKFGEANADEAAANVFRNEFPDRDIVAVSIPWVASGGGGIHCATHEFPSTMA